MSSRVTGIFPSEAAVNTSVPYLVYTVLGSSQNQFNDGPSSLVNYTFQVEGWAENLDTLSDIMSAVKSTLNGWNGGQVQLCSFGGHSTDEQEDGFHGTDNYSVWVGEPNVLMLADSTGTITTGPDFVSLTACENVVRLDCQGLSLNGEQLAKKGEAGLPGQTYVFEQSTPATTWTIPHNLNQYPSVTVVDSGGNVVDGDTQFVSANLVNLYFTVAFGGKAYLN